MIVDIQNGNTHINVDCLSCTLQLLDVKRMQISVLQMAGELV